LQLASFQQNGTDCIGVLKNSAEISVIDSIGEMTELIRLGGYAKDHIDHALADGRIVACDDVQWYPPIRRPGKICGVAMNNSASNERKISAPDHPAFFLKPSSCLVGHNQPIRIRQYYGSVHPEPELAVVIGRTMRDVDAKDALSCVFGYTIFNDITGNGMRADDLFHYWALYADGQNPGELTRHEQHLSYAARYKGADTFGCMGPLITTVDEIDNPDDLDVSCKIGGETIAEDSTRYYNYKVAELISYISQFLTLEIGDVISCGTAFKPSKDRRSIHHANFQRVAGPVEVTIGTLGTLRNSIEIEEQVMGRWQLS
jgi:2-keto-4-pentenoate hydratase/2-oxohepta-3-ene-1,7-dioic acid hydratase in catechol pathway